MKRIGFFFFVCAIAFFFSGEFVFASCREVLCRASSCGAELEVTNACKAEKGCLDKACIPNSFVSNCPNFNTQCSVSCTGEDVPMCSNVVCPTGTKYCKASSTCTGGACKAACDTAKGESEDAACSASQCASQPTNKKYCKTGGGTTAPAEKCDPEKFKEYAGVCFPINTGLSETSVAAIVMNLMKWMLYLFGFLAIIAFVVSGIQYLAASGNMNMIETAKRNMKFSILGVIVALAGLVIIVAIDALLRGTAW